jgi:hypothetical protein
MTCLPAHACSRARVREGEETVGSSGFCAKLQTTAQAVICARCAMIGFPRAEVGGRVGLHAERAGVLWLCLRKAGQGQHILGDC